MLSISSLPKSIFKPLVMLEAFGGGSRCVFCGTSVFGLRNLKISSTKNVCQGNHAVVTTVYTKASEGTTIQLLLKLS